MSFTVNGVDILEAIKRYHSYQELDKPRVIIRGDLSSTKVIYPINGNIHTNRYHVDIEIELDNLKHLIRKGNPDLNRHQAYIEQYKKNYCLNTVQGHKIGFVFIFSFLV